MLLAHDRDDDTARLADRTRGLAAVGLGISISTDELAIGFSLGLVGAPIALAIVLIALQAFVATQLGLRLGARAGSRVREGAERVAGVALIVLAVVLAALRVFGVQALG
jgi:putative Mn2+ efflux pump MntP